MNPQKHIRVDEIRITQNDPNITKSNTTANSLTEAYKFTCPANTVIHIRPGDIFSLYLADTTPTELAGSSRVKISHKDPNGIVALSLSDAEYTVFKEFQDRNKLFTFGQEVWVTEDDTIIIEVTGNLATSTSAQCKMQLSAERAARIPV